MFRFIRSIFAWQFVKIDGIWLYEQNAVSGRRRATEILAGGYSPVDLDWLDAGNGHPLINGRPAWRSAAGQIDGRYCY